MTDDEEPKGARPTRGLLIGMAVALILALVLGALFVRNVADPAGAQRPQQAQRESQR